MTLLIYGLSLALLLIGSACESDDGGGARYGTDTNSGEDSFSPDIAIITDVASDIDPGDGSETVCTPACGESVCGDDGCGGSCGSCGAGEACAEGACVPCIAVCGDRVCGDDGCNGSCGDCDPGAVCNDWGQCVLGCQPACLGRECGDDSCGGSCGVCGEGGICTTLGHCEALPSCGEVTKIGCCDAHTLWACDGGVVEPTSCAAEPSCGWSAGEGGYACGTTGEDSGQAAFPRDCPWVCHPSCDGRDCGDDGCGGLCGSCAQGEACDPTGACCAPMCEGADNEVRECGSDGCGGSCGACAEGESCGMDGRCVEPCAGACDGKVCGPDGCGGLCGVCDAICTDAGQCVTTCTPNCVDLHGDLKVCGPDGCGGSCGLCPGGAFCQGDGSCGETCEPACEGRFCGPDGCDGSCGDCTEGVLCSIDGQCGTACVDCIYGPGCMSFGFEGGNLAGLTTIGTPTVLGSFGVESPPEGAYMLDLDNGSELDDDAVIIQTCAPPGTATLHFLWRLYSEEFVEFCGSEYQDFFRVTLGYEATEGDESAHTVVFSRSIDELCPADACFTCGAQHVGLVESDIDFDQGDAWATPWVAENLIIGGVLPPGGSVITMTFEVGDAGDAIYQTHVLVDEITLLTDCVPGCSAADGGAKDCGSDGCGGLCGSCGAFSECSADGQCLGCQPACTGPDGAAKACGPDGCGGVCGQCPNLFDTCSDAGLCVGCQPNCAGKVCGSDGCGGSCGFCSDPFDTCSGQGQCLPCHPACEGKTCGDDGCGGLCGECGDEEACYQDNCTSDLPEIGSPCETDVDCADGMYCYVFPLFPIGDGPICTIECVVDAPPEETVCPEGFACLPADLFNPDGPGYCAESGGTPNP